MSKYSNLFELLSLFDWVRADIIINASAIIVHENIYLFAILSQWFCLNDASICRYKCVRTLIEVKGGKDKKSFSTVNNISQTYFLNAPL